MDEIPNDIKDLVQCSLVDIIAVIGLVHRTKDILDMISGT